MKTIVAPEIREIMAENHYRPSISIIMPFEPKMTLKADVTHSLKVAVQKVEKELRENYPGEMSSIVLQKLKTVINNLNFNTHKKSIAIYVSPLFEKVLYLDIPVEERIVVDESFEIRDLVYSKKQIHKYLVLLLSGKECRIFLGNTTTFVRIVSNNIISVGMPANEIPEKVANFSDSSDLKEIIMEKFLHQTDNALDIILNAYRLPLFVVGTKRITGHFKKMTRHGKAVIDYVHGNYEEASSDELREVLQPHIADWNKVIQKDLLNKLEDASGKKKLAVGMKEVWQEAMNRHGRLLVVEKNFMYAAPKNENENLLDGQEGIYNKFSFLKDAVDDVIEKVLESGGDVEFVDTNLLQEYGRIALIQYY